MNKATWATEIVSRAVVYLVGLGVSILAVGSLIIGIVVLFSSYEIYDSNTQKVVSKEYICDYHRDICDFNEQDIERLYDKCQEDPGYFIWFDRDIE